MADRATSACAGRGRAPPDRCTWRWHDQTQPALSLSGHTYVTEHIDPCKTGALHSAPHSFVEFDEGFLQILPLKARWLLYIPCSNILHSTHRMHFFLCCMNLRTNSHYFPIQH